MTKLAISNRFWEIDVVRGIAFLLMVVDHLLFYLALFGWSTINDTIYPWKIFQMSSGTLFLLLVGFSLEPRWQKHQRAGQTFNYFVNQVLQRAFIIYCYAAVVTLVTWFIAKDQVIVFGILHLIATSLLLSLPFFYWPKLTIPVALLIVGVGAALNNVLFNFPFLVWLGFMPFGFRTLDYYPVIPWFGVVLIGIDIARKLVNRYQRQYQLPQKPTGQPIRVIEWIGQRALPLYMIHHPLLFSGLYVIKLILTAR